jgi:hypothetical protein
MGLLENLAKKAGILSDDNAKEEAAKMLHGQKAVDKVEELEGELTPVQRRIVELEGYVPTEYEDTKGIVTKGVGQTGNYMDMSFKEVAEIHEDVARNLINDYDELPVELQAELAQLAYRGDLQQSNETVALFNKGKYEEASVELLNNKEFKSEDTPEHIKQRLRDASRTIAMYEPEGITVALRKDKLDSMSEYVVQKGDTVYSIAKKFDKTVAEVVDDNKIKDVTKLQIGQKILV